MTKDLLLFIPLALVAVASALGMLFSKNAIYAALNLIINFGTVAVFYLILGASFIALAQITVYAGAIMVLFVFVIMLLGVQQLHGARRVTWQEIITFVTAAVLLIEATYVIFVRAAPTQAPGYTTVSPAYGTASAVGLELFYQYLLPFEITSFLLLVAMIGAIILSKRRRKITSQARQS